MPEVISRIISGLDQIRKYYKKPLVFSKFLCFAVIFLSLLLLPILDNPKKANNIQELEESANPIQIRQLAGITDAPERSGSLSYTQEQLAQQERKQEREGQRKAKNEVSESDEEDAATATETENTTAESAVANRESGSSVYVPYGILEGDFTRVKDLGIYNIVGYDAYCSHCVCKEKPDGITASGVKAKIGRTVATHKSIPFGTILEIEGLGYYVVEDRGVGVGMIDVASANHASCYLVTSERRVWIVE